MAQQDNAGKYLLIGCLVLCGLVSLICGLSYAFSDKFKKWVDDFFGIGEDTKAPDSNPGGGGSSPGGTDPSGSDPGGSDPGGTICTASPCPLDVGGGGGNGDGNGGNGGGSGGGSGGVTGDGSGGDPPVCNWVCPAGYGWSGNKDSGKQCILVDNAVVEDAIKYSPAVCENKIDKDMANHTILWKKYDPNLLEWQCPSGFVVKSETECMHPRTQKSAKPVCPGFTCNPPSCVGSRFTNGRCYVLTKPNYKAGARTRRGSSRRTKVRRASARRASATASRRSTRKRASAKRASAKRNVRRRATPSRGKAVRRVRRATAATARQPGVPSWRSSVLVRR